tara:strand:+ start:3787 stop:5004 length:1218 start_codon:yes stop_codon:yes gene_type:complete
LKEPNDTQDKVQANLCLIGDAGGAHVRRRVRALADAGASVDLLTPRASGLCHHVNINETVVTDDGGNDIYASWSRAIAASGAPLVNIHYASSHGAWTFALSGDSRPMILNVMGGDVLFDEQSNPHAIARHLTGNVLRRADRVTVKSAFLGTAACNAGARSDAIERLFWGIDRDVFRPGSKPQARLDMGLPAQGSIVFSARPLRPFYRIDVILEALAEIRNAGKDIHLVVSGYEAEPRYLSMLKARATELDLTERVIFRPPMTGKDMVAMYQAADISVGIPPSDGFPQTVLEAMACDCVNVMSPLARYREFVADDESAVFVAPTAEALAIELVRLFDDPSRRQRIIAGGRSVIDRLPTLAASASRMLDIARTLPAKTAASRPAWPTKLFGRAVLVSLARRHRQQGV